MTETMGEVVQPSERFDPANFVRSLTQRPGVYRMLDDKQNVIYVGKARNLRRRVSSYFSGRGHDAKTLVLVRTVASVEVTVTRTETEALMLEYNLIKQHKPRFNVLLRDDKSYPYIRVSTTEEYPRISFYRGTRKVEDRLFGPYPNAGSVRESLSQLQKLFKIRQCENSYFSNRSRPCLQHQIDRCTAPCVNRISQAEYRRDVDNAMLFLEGNSDAVTDSLATRMEEAAAEQSYERAAQFRDRLLALKQVQSSQLVSRAKGDFDTVAVVEVSGIFCVTVMYVRNGRSLGNRNFFPKQIDNASIDEVIRAFFLHYYGDRDAPGEIITNCEVADSELIADMLSERLGRRVKITWRVRGDRAKLVKIALTNATHAAEQRIRSRVSIGAQFDAVSELLSLSEPAARLECFDISHTAGEATVGSCVVFNREGPLKSDYRHYNIKNIVPGDDYGAMLQVLRRRFARVKSAESLIPDVVIVDGGKGQLAQAVKVLSELEIPGIQLLGVAKGLGRRAGRESLYVPSEEQALAVPAGSPALALIQQLRDESHRFAVTGHRAQRSKRTKRSYLEDIHGLGPKRRQALLRQFGGLQGVQRASSDDLARVHGISMTLAQRIYDNLHAD
jgi:excinuclease ABC subunit C